AATMLATCGYWAPSCGISPDPTRRRRPYDEIAFDLAECRRASRSRLTVATVRADGAGPVRSDRHSADTRRRTSTVQRGLCPASRLAPRRKRYIPMVWLYDLVGRAGAFVRLRVLQSFRDISR